MTTPSNIMSCLLSVVILAAGGTLQERACAQAPSAVAVIHSEPLHSGRINPRLFGNFIELLDDVVPGLWAEMLNDRSFEGVQRAIDPVYFDGSPNVCDREWDGHPTWTYDTQNPFNGARSARLTATRRQPASLTQSGLATRRGLSYLCSGWMRSDAPRLKVTVALQALLPDGRWTTLARAGVAPPGAEWAKFTVELKSAGETDRAVFALRVEGEGRVWLDKVSLMPADHQHGWRRDVVEAIRQLQPKLIRWGGSVCDPGEYRWKNGIGDRDRRVPFTNKNWGRLDPNDVGIDEFCQLCELTGTEPLICLSFSDGPQSAADLVEYCNGEAGTPWGSKRAANGHPASYRIRYWQVGNEISGDDPKYLEQFGAFAALMRKADAGVALLSSFPSAKLLERYGREIAYVGPHHYTRNFAECERDFHRLKELVQGTPGCGHLKVAVTEWNESGGEWGLGRGRQMTLQNALHNARYLNLLMRNSDTVEIACRSSLANSFCGGVLETSPSGILKRPGYYALQLFARHARPIPLRVEAAGDGLDVTACANEDRTAVAVFVVNSKARPLDWSFRLEGFDGTMRNVRAECLGDTLEAAQPDVMNHWEAPERVRIVQLPAVLGKVRLPPLSVTVIECGEK